MKTSGYNTPYIRKLLYNGIKSYEDKLQKSKLSKDHTNYKSLHLSKGYNASKRREDKLLSKTDWYRCKNKDAEQNHEVPDGMQDIKMNNIRHRKPSRRLEELEQVKNQPKTRQTHSTIMFVPWTIRGRLAAELTGF